MEKEGPVKPPMEKEGPQRPPMEKEGPNWPRGRRRPPKEYEMEEIVVYAPPMEKEGPQRPPMERQGPKRPPSSMAHMKLDEPVYPYQEKLKKKKPMKKGYDG
jgi:hypothetical protein